MAVVVPVLAAVATRRCPRRATCPGLGGATGWLNSQPLTAEALRGKVVLVDFWTYTCINWLRTLAYVRAWAGSTGTADWCWSASTRPSSPSSNTSITFATPPRRCASGIRSRSIATMRSGAFRQPVLAGRLHRRRGRSDPPPPVRRGWVRRLRTGSSSSCCGRRGLREWPITPSPSTPGRLRGPGRLDERALAGDVPRLSTGPELAEADQPLRAREIHQAAQKLARTPLSWS